MRRFGQTVADSLLLLRCFSLISRGLLGGRSLGRTSWNPRATLNSSTAGKVVEDLSVPPTKLRPQPRHVHTGLPDFFFCMMYTKSYKESFMLHLSLIKSCFASRDRPSDISARRGSTVASRVGESRTVRSAILDFERQILAEILVWILTVVERQKRAPFLRSKENRRSGHQGGLKMKKK
jgi:hypothetical protein